MKNNPTCIRVFADEKQINICKEKLQSGSSAIRQLSNILALTGNETRLGILFLLAEEGELCPCDLADILGMSIPAVSQHLRKMRDGNIVHTRREAQTIYYSIKEDQMELLRPLFNHITNQKFKITTL